MIRWTASLPRYRAEDVMDGAMFVLGGVPRLKPDIEYLHGSPGGRRVPKDDSDARRVAIATRQAPRCPGQVIGTVYVLGEAVFDAPTARYHISECPHEGDLPHQRGGLWLFGDVISLAPLSPPMIIEDQRPHNEWEPGARYWILSDPVRSVDRCPLCNGTGLDDPTGHGDWCPACNGNKVCDPIPVSSGRGTRGMWDLGARIRATR